MSIYQVPDNILERVIAKDSLLTDDLTLCDMVEIYSELSKKRWIYQPYHDSDFIRNVLIPKKTISTTGNFLTKEEWKSLTKFPEYNNYVCGTIDYFSENAANKEEIKKINVFLLTEDVDLSNFDSGRYLRKLDPRMLKFIIDLVSQSIRWILGDTRIRHNIPLLMEIFSYAKDKVPKEPVLEFLDERTKYGMHNFEKGVIEAMLESCIISFAELYDIIFKYNNLWDRHWARSTIEHQV